MGLEPQFTVFLENKPGRLLNICAALAKEKVSIQGLTVMDGREHTVLRFVVDNKDRAQAALQKIGTPYSLADVFIVELKHQPGALAHLCERLAAEHVNIDYMYGSAGRKNGKAVAVFKATPLGKVKSVLSTSAPARPQREPVRRVPIRKQ